MPTTKRHIIRVQGQDLDRKLLDAFKREGKDGSVTKAKVEEKIAPRLRDAGKLTDIEISTVEYAAKTVSLTKGAKASLGEIAQEMRGKPVFSWQRGTSGVDVRVNPGLPLSAKAAERAALDWVLHNVEPVLGASADKPLPHLDSGNQNLHPSIIKGEKAEKAVALFRELEGRRAHELLKTFDPKKHTAIFTVGTEDETHIFLAILDRTTGKTAFVGEQNTVDIGSMVDEAKFVEIFGGFRQFSYDPNDPDADYDTLDGHTLAEWLQEGADFLPVEHSDDGGALNALAQAQYERSEAIKDALGDASYKMPIDIASGRLPVAEDLDVMARLMFESSRNEDSGIHYVHDGVPITVAARERPTAAHVDEIAAALVASYPHEHGAAGLAKVKEHVKAAIAALGDPAQVALHQVTAKVQHETDRAKTTTARAFAFIHEKTGDFVSFYTRPDMP